jgi:hypothetical protein
MGAQIQAVKAESNPATCWGESPDSEIRSQLARAVLDGNGGKRRLLLLALGPTESATVFRSEIEQGSLMTLKKNLARIQGSTTTEAQYNKAMAFVRKDSRTTRPATALGV